MTYEERLEKIFRVTMFSFPLTGFPFLPWSGLQRIYRHLSPNTLGLSVRIELLFCLNTQLSNKQDKNDVIAVILR